MHRRLPLQRRQHALDLERTLGAAHRLLLCARGLGKPPRAEAVNDDERALRAEAAAHDIAQRAHLVDRAEVAQAFHGENEVEFQGQARELEGVQDAERGAGNVSFGVGNVLRDGVDGEKFHVGEERAEVGRAEAAPAAELEHALGARGDNFFQDERGLDAAAREPRAEVEAAVHPARVRRVLEQRVARPGPRVVVVHGGGGEAGAQGGEGGEVRVEGGGGELGGCVEVEAVQESEAYEDEVCDEERHAVNQLRA